MLSLSHAAVFFFFFQFPIFPFPVLPSRKHNNTTCLALGRARFLTRQIQSRTPRSTLDIPRAISVPRHHEKPAADPPNCCCQPLNPFPARRAKEASTAPHCTLHNPRCTHCTAALQPKEQHHHRRRHHQAQRHSHPRHRTHHHQSLPSQTILPSVPIVPSPADRLVAATSAPTGQPRQPNTGRQTSARRGNRPLFLPSHPPLQLRYSEAASRALQQVRTVIRRPTRQHNLAHRTSLTGRLNPADNNPSPRTSNRRLIDRTKTTPPPSQCRPTARMRLSTL